MEAASIFATKPVKALVADAERGPLRRVVGLLDLTALGVGAIIGTGIFVIIGEAIGLSGPSIVISFLLAGVTCVFSALAYAELASAIPVSGSAYTYGYATLGELAAWIIGWDLLLEYSLAVAAVAVGWGGYLKDLLDTLFSINLPQEIANPPGEGGSVNVPALFLIVCIGALLVTGVRQSARTNAVMVFVKIGVLLLFIALALTAFSSDNLSPFFVNGFDGAEEAAALIFFAYIGFDAISTSGEETENPRRHLPLAIIGSLVVATVLYIAVAIAATGAISSGQLAGDPAPLATALEEGAGLDWGATLISIGALVAITSVVLTMYYGQTRITYAMSRDGLLPSGLARVWERTGTPVVITLVSGLIMASLAAFVPLTQLAELVNIGTLFAFLIVNLGVIILRRTRPEMERGFRVPLVPVFPLVGAGLCLYLMTKLPLETWIRFGIWMAAGVLIYAAYGYRHSLVRSRAAEPAASGPG
jgi:basic amino acid/polyamine antiporter, APA family